MKYEKPKPEKKQKKKRGRRNILWYNPPYNMTVTTNLGEKFLDLIKTHFPKKNKLHKILNRSTVKLSYSCTKNFKAIIQTHNAKVFNNNKQAPPANKCNCRKKDKCPMENKCTNHTDVVYHAKLEEGTKKEYIGCAQDFKKRYYGHTESFRNESSKHKTTLSTHVWENKMTSEPKIKWSIIDTAKSYTPGNRYCDLCLSEKYHILKNINNPSFLNKRSELAQRCRHKAKYLLQSHK